MFDVLLDIMRSRSSLLWEISKHLPAGTRLNSIPDLRVARPGISALYPDLGLKQLEEVLARLQAGDVFDAPQKPRRFSDRDLDIAQSARNGESLASLGREHGLSRQRIAQIVARVNQSASP